MSRSKKSAQLNKPSEPLPDSTQPFLSAAVNAFPERVALIDKNGVLVLLNDMWDSFLQQNGLNRLVAGADFIAHVGSRSEEAAAGLGEVLAGKKPQFLFDYPYYFSGRHNWFRFSVMPVKQPDNRYFLVAEQDITNQKIAELNTLESHYKFRSLFEQASDAILLIREEICVDCNQKAAELFATGREHIIQKRILDFSPVYQPDGQFSSEKALDIMQQLRMGHSQLFEWRYNRADGSTFDSEVSLTPVGIKGDQLIQVIIRDISERKHVIEKLRESEERLKVLFEHAPDAYHLHDSEGNFLDVNRAAEKLLGYSRQELIGNNLLSLNLLASDQVHVLTEIFAGSVLGERSGPVELAIRRKDGQTIEIEMMTHPINLKDESLVLINTRNITERKRNLRALKESEERYRQFFEDDLTGDFISTVDGRLLACNKAFADIFGFTSTEEAMEKGIAMLYPNAESRNTLLNLVRANRKIENYEQELRRLDGKTVHVVENIIGIFNDQDELIQTKGYLFEITKQKELARQLLHAQKMEAIGRLAGGVAHDFNNLLTVIRGYSDLILESDRNTDNDTRNEKLQQINAAARRAEALTRQLLAFSRKQNLQPKILELNALIRDMEKLVSRLIGEDINLQTVLDPALGHIMADPGQIEQVILNLIVNARDAMPKGGDLLLETRNVHLDDEYVGQHHIGRPGDYVMLSISDSGVGMDKETQAQVFEPFFTTKEEGRGTGLGLATAYGIVKQSDGYIWVYSEPGKGTTFKIYLPRIDQPLSENEEQKKDIGQLKGHETILVIEDEESVRSLVCDMLSSQGYEVLEAQNGIEAGQILENHHERIDLVLTDVIMPEMTGPKFVEEFGSQYPQIKIVYMSGYTDDAITRHGILTEHAHFIQKPFTAWDLASKIKEILNKK